MKKFFKRLFWLFNLTLFCGCTTIQPPPEFIYIETPTDDFTIASWQKITSPQATYKIYIEGDGHAFNAHGTPTSDPTPRGELLRELAFADTSPNIIYLARPCQYLSSPQCSVKYWTTARFAPEVINSSYQAIKQIAGNNQLILIGFSGGAQIAELLAATTDLNVKKIITIAGNLDHTAWTAYHHLPTLSDSLNAADYRAKLANIPQTHYTGTDDWVIPPKLSRQIVSSSQLIEVPNATHSSGWQKIYPLIWQEQ